MPKFKKFIPVLMSGTLFTLTLWQIQPPQSLPQASPIQLIALFGPLLIFISSVVFLIFKSLPIGIACGLTFIILLTLKSLDLLNIITLIVIVVALLFIVKALKKEKQTSYQAKIPKLSQLKKQ